MNYTLQFEPKYKEILFQTYGAEEDKTLGIENEDASNVIAARNFVGWYNGLPCDRDLKVCFYMFNSIKYLLSYIFLKSYIFYRLIYPVELQLF